MRNSIIEFITARCSLIIGTAAEDITVSEVAYTKGTSDYEILGGFTPDGDFIDFISWLYVTDEIDVENRHIYPIPAQAFKSSFEYHLRLWKGLASLLPCEATCLDKLNAIDVGLSFYKGKFRACDLQGAPLPSMVEMENTIFSSPKEVYDFLPDHYFECIEVEEDIA